MVYFCSAAVGNFCSALDDWMNSTCSTWCGARILARRKQSTICSHACHACCCSWRSGNLASEPSSSGLIHGSEGWEPYPGAATPFRASQRGAMDEDTTPPPDDTNDHGSSSRSNRFDGVLEYVQGTIDGTLKIPTRPILHCLSEAALLRIEAAAEDGQKHRWLGVLCICSRDQVGAGNDKSCHPQRPSEGTEAHRSRTAPI